MASEATPQYLPPMTGHDRACYVTTSEFEKLVGQVWSDSFRRKIGIRATKLYAGIYKKKKPPQKRTTKHQDHRNKVNSYPCGILEQAYRQLCSEGAAQDVRPGGLLSS
jgi:hypothetical protein